jgi:serine/threonine-protein kinase
LIIADGGLGIAVDRERYNPSDFQVSLNSGTRLGPYEILSLVGAGGMGEVYKARDTRLDRTVAIKILAPTLAADAQFRERFEREARAISQVEHPHICALHDVGEQAGTAYLVMQYLDGETLADRLAKGALPIGQALATAIEIASALDRAHQAGIVHRDLKPGNIMLTRGGAKLLDFGLAKSVTSVVGIGSGSPVAPTITNLTAQGAVLGTFQYMAPEQIEGHEADARTDIFAFGAVLYEMVTGARAFSGKSHASLISSILKDEPRPVTELQPRTPPLLDHIVSRCLAKDPDERWQSAADLTRELQWISSTGMSDRAMPAAAAPSRLRERVLFGTAVALAGLIVGSLVTLMVIRSGASQSAQRPPTIVRSAISIAPAEHLQAIGIDRTTNEGRPSRTAMAWSPDGRSIIFSALQGDRQQLYVRTIDQLTATAMSGTEGGGAPFFSPDGHWVAFWSGGALKKTPADGNGPATTICEVPTMFGASWGADDTIIFSRSQLGLFRVSAGGGTPQVVAAPDIEKGELKYLLPQILPGDRTVIFTVTHTPLPTWEDTEIVAQSLTTGARKVLVKGGADGRYLQSGHLAYIRRGTLMAMPFALDRLEATGGAVALIADVMQAANEPSEQFDTGAGQFSVSASGALLYVPGGIFPDPERSLVWVDRATGAVQPLPLPTKPYLSPRISPDGRQAVVWTQGDRNIWLHDFASGTLTKLTSEGRNARAIWTLDGKSVTYGSAVAGNEHLLIRPADGSGSAETLTKGPYLQYAAAWSPSDNALVYVEQVPDFGQNIMVMPLSGDRRPRPLVQTRFTEAYPDFSPDGRWLAYSSDESNRPEVYVQPYPGPGPRKAVSANGGTGPAWSHDGRELFYTTTQSTGGQAVLTRMMVVPVTLRPTFSAGAARQLFEGRYGATAGIRSYDVTADGKRFLMVQQKERPAVAAAEMVLVQNWLEELKARVPVK